jgi:hypothetical protein
MNDELGLPSRAFQRHDREPSGVGSDLRAKIASNEVKRRTFLRELLRDGRSDPL